MVAMSETPQDAQPLTQAQRHVISACWLLGGFARLVYIIVLHPATKHVYSDMQGYYDRAVRFAMHSPENISDTLYPPGMPMMLGWLFRLDPSLYLAMIVQWLLSLVTMGLVWLIARRVYGTSAAVVALVIATLYFPFVHYASLLLAEAGFTVFALGSIWLLLVALQATTRRIALMAALLAGVAVGLASAFKNTMIGPFAVTGLVCAVYAFRTRHQYPMRGFIAISLALLIGLSTLMVPLAQRCTRINDGHFCVSANNIGMNILLGHYGPVREFRWVDNPHQITLYFTAIESTFRGYTGDVTLDFGAYDSKRNTDLALAWIAAHPAEALWLSLRNVWSLFAAPTFWPPAQSGRLDWGKFSQCFFWCVILIPAFTRLARCATAMLRFERERLKEWIVLAPIIGLMISVFISITEVRFRIPFDGLFIVLAAKSYIDAARWFWRGSRPGVRDTKPQPLRLERVG